MFSIPSRFRALLLVTLVSACTAPDPSAVFNDPYEENNRVIHAFNKSLDSAFLRPSGGVTATLPDGVTDPIVNFADNAGLPGAVANGVLQANLEGAAINTLRFVLNTTLGVGGLLDPASTIGLTEQDTDFGETLAVWGFDEGAYLEIPVYGPSTERDAAGRLVDLFLDPLGAVGLPAQVKYGPLARVATLAVRRGDYKDTIDGLLYDSADSYSQARLVYLQNRRFELGEAPPAATEIDPFSGDVSLEGFE
ncbi:MlaA family lipoprotein [Thalassorhabdomicrobium marinisediminis]|uniref:MlaA family lipoprotein n=1 Tax=Thalassorhabdomicrobium marinisediminis TaxID=2170577 RepID=UPI002491B031|nr:VacJ family lipoprotein [Thalassorhabdomicrobium marinisediminis]